MTVAAVELDGASLDLATIGRLLCTGPVDVRLTDPARSRMTESRKGALEALDAGARVYGWNQAVGPLKDRPLDPGLQREFQRRMLLSHAAGQGPALPWTVARLAMVLRANAMARGATGVRPEVVDRMLSMVGAGVIPLLPEVGSLGCGDLQPMAAAGLSMSGEFSPVLYKGRTMTPRDALRAAGLPERFTFEAGEALPLVSGGSVLTARAADAAERAARATDAFEVAFALFLEATRAGQDPFDPRAHAEGAGDAQVAAAARIRALVGGTGWMTDEGRRRAGETGPRIQDASTVRAEPRMVGALRRTIDELRDAVVREANSSTSNPLVVEGDTGYGFVTTGNWSADEIGHRVDALNARIAALGVLSQELSARLLDPRWSHGLPANLAGGAVGLNSGMVQVQTVAAALIPEMQIAAAPAGVLSRPVKGGQEDHNTMAMASVRNLSANLDRLDTVLGVQLMMAAQGVDLLRPVMGDLPLGRGTAAAQRVVRARITPLGDDRYLSPDLEAATEIVRSSALSRIVTGTGRPAD